MGGRGSGGAGGGGARGGSGSSRSLEQIDRQISRTPFSNEGGGSYELDIKGIGGGQVLDETGSSRDPMNGRGGKIYSVRTWDSNYNMLGSVDYVSTLNEAKATVKEKLRNHYSARG